MSSSRSIVHFALLAVVLVLAAGLADLAFTKLVASSPALEAGRLARLAAGKIGRGHV